MYEYRVYIINGKEYFQTLAGDDDEHRQTIELPLGESLLRFLEIDMSGCADAESMRRSFSGHPYSVFANKHTPAYIIAMHDQIRELVTRALTNPQGKEKAMDRLTEYYHGGDEDKFTLRPITTYYDIVGDSGLCEILDPMSIEDILSFTVRAMAEANVFFKTCKHCGKYFNAGHGNAQFCERQVDAAGKTCRDIGSQRLYREKAKQNPILVEYDRAYKRNFARIRTKRLTVAEFREWGERARAYRDAVLAGKRAPEELRGILNQ